MYRVGTCARAASGAAPLHIADHMKQTHLNTNIYIYTSTHTYLEREATIGYLTDACRCKDLLAEVARLDSREIILALSIGAWGHVAQHML